MKLGLKIEITSQGAGNAAKSYNSTPALDKYASASRSFIKEVFPAREDLRLKGLDPLASLDESARSVVFLRFLGPDGYLICVFQSRPENSGRPYDGAAAWIHVPSSVMLTGIETEKLIEEVNASMLEDRGINYQRLDALFSKEYAQKNVHSALSTIGSNGKTSGIRYYGIGTDYQLSELLGKNIAQQVYGEYKAVFLLRKNDGIAVNAREITKPLTQTCTIKALPPIAGYNAFFESGMPFDKDLECPANSLLTIVWKKAGYQDVQKQVVIREGNSNEIAQLLGINNVDIKVAIKKQIFNVVGGGRSVPQYRISIDGAYLDDILYIQEEKLARGVKVEVAADGFLTYGKELKLAVDTPRVDIKLKEQSFMYEFSIPMYVDGEQIDDGVISVELNRRLEKCPIEGYSFVSEHIHEGEGRINRLERAGMKDAFKHFAYGFLTCIGVILAVILYNVVDNIKFKTEWPFVEFVKNSPTSSTNQTNTEESNANDNEDGAQADSVDYFSEKQAISYLNSNNIWNKDSIAKYPSLSGLFEAFNEYKFDEIVNSWASKLQDVPSFTKVVHAAEKAKSAPWNPRQGDHNPFYNKGNDPKISLDNYSNWISKDQTPKQESIKPEHLVNHIKPNAPVIKRNAEPGNKSNNKENKRGEVPQ